MADLCLINGTFYTQDLPRPRAQAAAVRDGRFRAVGSNDQILHRAGPDAEVIDLEGCCVLPGLTDAHFHFYDWALGTGRLSLAESHSLSNLCQRLVQRADETPSGRWILGRGWNESHWATPLRSGRLPSRIDLDDVAGNHPVIFWRSDMHLAVVNSAALREAGITSETPDPPQGVIDRDLSGQPTGVLRELAINLVSDVVPPPTEDETVEALRKGFTVLHRLGLTGIHDFRIMGGADGAPAFRAYQRLRASNALPLRLWMQLPGESLDDAIALGLRTGFGDDYLRVGHVKLFADGSQGARTAWMLEPYQDTGSCGMPLTPMEEIIEAVGRAHESGLSVAVHAIGDRANQELVTVFERVLGREQPSTAARPTAPHRIEHLQNIRPEDTVRLGRCRLPGVGGVVASVQPIHVTDDAVMIEQSVGERAHYAYPFRDMLDAGLTLALGSDCPVADPNPLWGIHAAVARQRRDGNPPGGWFPDQRITVAEAVWGFTMGPALATGREAGLGSIKPGKLADLVVLDRDIFAIDPVEIAGTHVVMTVFDGRVAYRR